MAEIGRFSEDDPDVVEVAGDYDPEEIAASESESGDNDGREDR